MSFDDLSQYYQDLILDLYKSKDTKDKKSFEQCKETFYKLFDVQSEYDEELKIVFMLSDDGNKEIRFWKNEEKDDGFLQIKEFTSLVHKIPQEKTNKEKMFGELFFNLIRNGAETINRTQFEIFFSNLVPKVEVVDINGEFVTKNNLMKDLRYEVIEMHGDNVRYKIQSDRWKDYLGKYNKNNSIVDEIFYIVAGEKDKDAVISKERFISWYINCC